MWSLKFLICQNLEFEPHRRKKWNRHILYISQSTEKSLYCGIIRFYSKDMPMFYELVIKKYSYQKKKRDHFFVFMEEVHLPQTLDLILTILNSEEQKLNCLFFY